MISRINHTILFSTSKQDPYSNPYQFNLIPFLISSALPYFSSSPPRLPVIYRLLNDREPALSPYSFSFCPHDGDTEGEQATSTRETKFVGKWLKHSSCWQWRWLSHPNDLLQFRCCNSFLVLLFSPLWTFLFFHSFTSFKSPLSYPY